MSNVSICQAGHMSSSYMSKSAMCQNSILAKLRRELACLVLMGDEVTRSNAAAADEKNRVDGSSEARPAGTFIDCRTWHAGAFLVVGLPGRRLRRQQQALLGPVK